MYYVTHMLKFMLHFFLCLQRTGKLTFKTLEGNITRSGKYNEVILF